MTSDLYLLVKKPPACSASLSTPSSTHSSSSRNLLQCRSLWASVSLYNSPHLPATSDCIPCWGVLNKRLALVSTPIVFRGKEDQNLPTRKPYVCAFQIYSRILLTRFISNKAVAYGAVLSHVDRDNHKVALRVARVTYGLVYMVRARENDQEHIRRRDQWIKDVDDEWYVPRHFEAKLCKVGLIR